MELVPQADGSILEREAPLSLRDTEVTILPTYGNLHLSGAAMLEEILPSAQSSNQAVVILQLRGLDNIGSTFIRVIERYAQNLQMNGGKLYLTGVHPRVLEQLELTETTDTISGEAIYLAEDKLGASTRDAYQSARTWLENVRRGNEEISAAQEDIDVE